MNLLKTIKSKAIVLGVAIGFMTMASTVFAENVYAASSKYDFKNIDEQRAVNLYPDDLVSWANYKGYDISWETLWDQNGNEILAFTVTHPDVKGDIYRKALSAGKAAMDKYSEGMDEAMNNLPGEIVFGDVKLDQKEIENYLQEQGGKNVTSLEGLSAIGQAVSSAGKEGKLLVSCRYYYDNMNAPAIVGRVFMSSTGRDLRYSFSQIWNDANGTTSDGYSIKPEKKKKLGYLYKQEIVELNNQNYWMITVKPM